MLLLLDLKGCRVALDTPEPQILDDFRTSSRVMNILRRHPSRGESQITYLLGRYTAAVVSILL